MTMYTESEIKRQLDGSFWFLDQAGVVHHKFVDLDYIPSHRPGAVYSERERDQDNAPGGGYRINWPSNAFELIDQMREDRLTWPMIGQVFGASAQATSDFYRKRQAKKQLEQDKAHFALRSKEVTRMLLAGWDETKIQTETGYSKELIKNVAERIRRKKR